MAGHKVLLIVDAQVNMFDSPPLYRAEEVLSTLQVLIAQARAAGTPVIYVRHTGPPGDVDEWGSPGWEIHPAIVPQAKDTIVDKTQPDAFAETTLQQELESHQIRELILAGMQTDMCTTRPAAVPSSWATMLRLSPTATAPSTATRPPRRSLSAITATLARWRGWFLPAISVSRELLWPRKAWLKS